MNKVLIAPSILSADFAKLGEEIRDAERSGCDLIHVDVMDGHFVPNLTIGPSVIKSLRKVTKLPFDVHLMIENPIDYLESYRKAGADWLTVHLEACKNVPETLEMIVKLGAKPGISLRPGTAVNKIEPFLKQVALILIMSVEPGFGGQSFMEDQLEKVKYLRSRFNGLISVDGGVNAENAGRCLKAGADILVAGTAVFGQTDRKLAIQNLRGE